MIKVADSQCSAFGSNQIVVYPVSNLARIALFRICWLRYISWWTWYPLLRCNTEKLNNLHMHFRQPAI